jgi:hypothetical protein
MAEKGRERLLGAPPRTWKTTLVLGVLLTVRFVTGSYARRFQWGWSADLVPTNNGNDTTLLSASCGRLLEAPAGLAPRVLLIVGDDLRCRFAHLDVRAHFLDL